MNKYYSFISLSFPSEHFSITFRGTLIYSVKKKILQTEVSDNVTDDQKFIYKHKCCVLVPY